MGNKSKFIAIVIGLFLVLILIVANIMLRGNSAEGTKEEVIVETAVEKIKEANFNEKVLESDKKVLVDFYADWCGPCKALSPIIEEVAKEREDAKFVKINVDTDPNVPEQYGVMYLPTLIVFENGEVVNKSTGLIGKEDIIKLIE